MTSVFIDGAEGTTGLRIRQRLNGREDIRLIAIDEAKRKDPQARRACIAESDITILCLPDAAAVEAAALAEGTGARIIDASTAHRTEPGWAYGFAELSPAHRAAIASGDRVSVPGCHASGMIALVYPLVSCGALPADYPVTCHSVTGYSGGGKKMIAEYESQGRDPALDSPRQYGLGQNHKHLKEMTKHTRLAFPPVFHPIVADFYSGMVVTVPLFTRLLPGHPTKADLHALLVGHYAGQKLVRVLPLGDEAMFPANALSGLDRMELSVFGNDDRVTLCARFDNLGKGASGAAIQCLNLMCGVPEETGLAL